MNEIRYVKPLTSTRAVSSLLKMSISAYVPSSGHPRDTPPVAALTTIFTPPASCLQTLFVQYYTQFQPPNNFGNTHLTLGLMQMSQCFPISYSEQYHHSRVGYYSPAVCPSGYTSACDVFNITTNGFMWGLPFSWRY